MEEDKTPSRKGAARKESEIIFDKMLSKIDVGKTVVNKVGFLGNIKIGFGEKN